MTPDHFQLDDIRSKFWREFADKFGPEPLFYLCQEIGGDRPPYVPTYESVMRLARDRAIRAGDDVEAYLSPRQERRIKSCGSTGNSGQMSD